MGDAGKSEGNEKESPPLKIDPKCIQDALRSFLQPIKTDDPRLDFYTMYKREATEYDVEYIKKYDEDLNTTLIFAGLFSAVSSAFVIDIHSNLQPNPNEQSAALLRAILLTLNQSAIPGEAPAAPPVQGDPASETVTVTCLMYASLIISLLAAFVAMLGKQWLNRYLGKSGGSMIERCRDRQHKFNGLEKWPLYFFVECLPVMLQAALLLLACGLCRHMLTINMSVACTLISFTGLGVAFYVGIVIAGITSYACPFQTPASATLRDLWKKVQPGIALLTGHCTRVLSQTRRRMSSYACPFQTLASAALRDLWKKVQHWIVILTIHYTRVLSRARRMWKQGTRSLLPRQSLPTATPPENIEVQGPEPWMTAKDLATTRRTNADDVLCVSWILKNITDPEALDAAVRLAGTIRWFDNGISVDPPYDLIVSTFWSCFDLGGRLYPGSKDKAYHSGRAMIWIHALATCKSRELGDRFTIPRAIYLALGLDHDFEHLLQVVCQGHPMRRILLLLAIRPEHTPSHLQWTSNVLLHLAWVNRTMLDRDFLLRFIPGVRETKIILPLDAALSRLLVWRIILDSPVDEELLTIQDKSNRIYMEHILRQLSEAIHSAIVYTKAHLGFIPHVLRDLVDLESRPECLTEIAYDWCFVIYKNRQSLGDWEGLILTSLEIGFRHPLPQDLIIVPPRTHTEYYLGMVDIVFKSQNGDAIADLLYSWTIGYYPRHIQLDTCAERLVCLHNLVPFTSRLRRLVILSVELIGYERFEGVGMERFVGLLNHLHVTAEDIDDEYRWARLLLDTIKSFEGTRLLSHWYWELLMELTISQSMRLRRVTYNSQIATFLTEAQEWNKLECWIGTVWILWPPEADGITEEDLGCSTLLLFRQRPGAFQKLEQWVERWSQKAGNDTPESFQRICEQAQEAAQRDIPPTLSAGTEEFVHSSPSGGSGFWESLPYHAL